MDDGKYKHINVMKRKQTRSFGSFANGHSNGDTIREEAVVNGKGPAAVQTTSTVRMLS